MGAKADLANLQLLALRVARRLVRDELIVAKHVQQRRLAGIVEAEKENASLLVVEAEGRQESEEPEEKGQCASNETHQENGFKRPQKWAMKWAKWQEKGRARVLGVRGEGGECGRG